MIRLITVIAAFTMLFSCKNENGGVAEEKMTSNGFMYTIVESNPGNKEIHATDYATVEIKVMGDNDETIQPLMSGSSAPVIPILTADQAKKNPVPLALTGAHEGDSLTIIIPMDSLPSVPPQYAGYKHMRYELRVTKVQSEAEHNAEMEALRLAGEKKVEEVKGQVDEVLKSFKSGGLKDLTVTDNDVKIHYLEKGSGDKINQGDNVNVHYYGALMSGTSFDNSFQQSQAFNVNVGTGMVIPGWDEALMKLNRGDKVVIFIPYRQAYGEAGAGGRIPPKSDLVFYMDILEE